MVTLLDAPSIPAGLKYLSVPKRRDSPTPPGPVSSGCHGLFAWENGGCGQGLWIVGEPWLGTGTVQHGRTLVGAGTVDHGRTLAGDRDCG